MKGFDWMEEMKQKRIKDLAKEIQTESRNQTKSIVDQVQAQIQGDPIAFGKSIVNEATNEVTKSFDFDMSM